MSQGTGHFICNNSDNSYCYCIIRPTEFVSSLGVYVHYISFLYIVHLVIRSCTKQSLLVKISLLIFLFLNLNSTFYLKDSQGA